MSTLSPFVAFLKRKRFPKIVAIFIPFLIALIFITLLIFSLLPFFISQVQSLIKIFPTYFGRAVSFFAINIDISQISSLISSEFASFGQNILDITRKIISGIFSLILIFVISFYFLLYEEHIKNGIVDLFPRDLKNRVSSILNQIEKGLGAWARGQVVLSAAVGFLTWIGLTILGLDFALPLALVAGILEIIPTLGPIISGSLAAIVALNFSFDMVIKVIFVFIFIHLLENNILVPRIMQRAVGLNPIIVLVGVIVGAKLMGLTGALLSIPFISLLVIIFRNLKGNK